MTMGRIVWVALVLSVANGQDRAGNQIFRIPEGWTRTESGHATILSPSAEPANQVALVLAGRPFSGDFRAAFDRDVSTMNGSSRVLNSGEVQSRHTPQGIDLLEVTVELQGPGRGRSARHYMAASVAGRYEMLAYIATTPLQFKRYWPVVQQFVSTWSFANLTSPGAPSSDASPPPAEPAVPAPAPAAPAANSSLPPDRLEGIYSGYKYIYATVLGVVQKKAVNDYFSFFANGTVFWGLPENGLANFDMARACQGRVEFCGTYHLSGDQIQIVLNRGTYKQVGSVIPGMIQIADRRYTLQGDPAKFGPHALEGDFMRADARPGEDLARRFIRFTRDGRFLDQGIVTVVTSADISTGNLRFEREGGSGTYTLAPFTLILRYSDGYQRQLGVTLQPSDLDKPGITQLFVNTYTLVRRR